MALEQGCLRKEQRYQCSASVHQNGVLKSAVDTTDMETGVLIKRARLLSMKSYTVISDHKVLLTHIWEVLVN